MSTPASSEEHGTRAEARRYEVAKAQVWRSQLPVALSHALVGFLVWQDGWPWGAAVWWLSITALNIGRSVHLNRLDFTRTDDLRRAPRVMQVWLLAVGLLRPIPLLLSSAVSNFEGQHLIMMIMLGLTVAGASNLAGLTRLYLVWSGPLFATMCGLWLMRADLIGLCIAVLLAMAFVLMGNYVREYGRLLKHEAELAANLRIERDRATAAVEDKTRFFAAASHDLRQPLAALRWYGDALVEYSNQEDDTLREIGVGILRALDRTEPLLGQYLEIARLDGEAHAQMKPALRELDAATILHQTADLWSQEASRRGLRLTVQLSAPSLPVLGEAEALRRILDNLVGNALKFTPTGEVCLEAGPESNDPTRLRLAVRDTGIGISPGHHERVFDEFVQLSGTARDVSRGVGLGLAIARRQAARLGSVLRLHSVPGAGSCFEFSLVRAKASQNRAG